MGILNSLSTEVCLQILPTTHIIYWMMLFFWDRESWINHPPPQVNEMVTTVCGAIDLDAIDGSKYVLSKVRMVVLKESFWSYSYIWQLFLDKINYIYIRNRINIWNYPNMGTWGDTLHMAWPLSLEQCLYLMYLLSPCQTLSTLPVGGGGVL